MIEEIFKNHTPKVQTIPGAHKFNRKERRNRLFVIRNNTNGLFVKRIKKGEKITYKDVELKDSSSWKYKSISYVLAELLVHEPNLDLEPCMVFKNKGELCVK